MMNYWSAPINYLINDKKWYVKIAILAACLFLVIPAAILGGYMLEVLRYTRKNTEGLDSDMPPMELEFARLVGYWVEGIRLGVQGLILCIPFTFCWIVGIFAFAISHNGEAGSVGLVIMLAAFLLGLVFCVLAALAMPAVYILASENKSWLAVTNFSRLKEIMTSSISTYIITTLVGMVYNFVASCVAGPFSVLTSPMACICNGQLLGQYARNMDLRSFA